MNGDVSQLAEVTEHTRSGARGLILPASHQIGNPSENTLLPGTVAELMLLGITPREVVLDGGFQPTPTNTALAALAALAAKTVFIAAHQEGASRHTRPARALPNRHRRSDQSSQTPLRAGSIPPEGRRGRADLD